MFLETVCAAHDTGAERNELIQFELVLDRVGFPLIPFVNSPTKATVAKYPSMASRWEQGTGESQTTPSTVGTSRIQPQS
ncbi:hypothetical protein CHU98_g8512 [Xylaria longipes]|nr:hypothetical protein CHU98_g8512 [Xylaria longipes]